MGITKDDKISYLLTFITFCIVIVGVYSIYCVTDIAHVRTAENSFNMVRIIFGQHTLVA
jgi:hypothetical protein